MITIVRNKYLNALLLLILGSAIAHIFIIFLIAIDAQSIHPLNYFAILSLDYFFPGIFGTAQADIISVALLIGIYLAILKVNSKQP